MAFKNKEDEKIWQAQHYLKNKERIDARNKAWYVELEWLL